MSEIKYSFIIPHKNCPELLTRCVDSIPKREDIQIIVVDDNSDADKKPSINRKGVEVVLLDAEHSKGAGRARNVGLEHAKGKWLLFADADDYYTDYLSTLLDKFVDDETTDIVYLNACMFDENENNKPFKTDKLIKKYLNKENGAEMDLRYNLWTPWSRMVRKEIVEAHHIKFDELPACNDKMFCLLCSHYAKKNTAILDIVYKYYKPSHGSQTDRKRNYKMLDGLLEVRCKTIDLYKKAGYTPIPSILELLYGSIYSKGLSNKEIFSKYWKTLTKAHVSVFVDVCRYIKKRFKKILK